MKLRNHIILLLLLLPTMAFAQQTYIPRSGEFELFAGAELNYRDITHEAQYEALINITPGFKWHLPYHLLIAAQAQIPVVNNYGDYYKNPRLSVLSVSEQFRLGRLALKPSVGMFSQERYGVDLKAMYPVWSWLALEAQLGVTGYVSMAKGWKMSHMESVLALGGVDFYISRWQSQIRAIGGRFLGGDYGLYIEGMRHFKYCTVGIFGDYSNEAYRAHGFNGGFKVTMALPPYRRRHRRFRVRPAESFLFSANMNAENLTNKVYNTDPEENSRHGWFSPDILPWGANLIYDYKEKEAEK